MPLEQRVRIDQRPTLPEVLPSDLIAGSRDQQAINWTAATLLKFITDARVFEQPDGTDFNVLDQRGTYILTSETNAPLPGPTNRWVVEVVADPADADRVVQRAYLLVGGAKLELANRRRLAGATWEPWLLGAGQAVDVGYDDSTAYSGAENVQEALEESANYIKYVENETTLQSFVHGLTLSNNADDPNNKIDIAPGRARGNGVTVVNPATITAALGAVAPNTTYHIHALRSNATGEFKVTADVSPTSPYIEPGYTRVQRLGAIVTDGSGNIRPFVQRGNEFRYNTVAGISEYVATGNRAKAPITVTLPTGARIVGIFEATIANMTSNDSYIELYDGDNPNVVTRFGMQDLNVSMRYSGEARQFTNASAQIQLAVVNGHSVKTSALRTLGWIDYQIPRIGA